MTDDRNSALRSPVGGEADVESVARELNPRQITAAAIADEPFQTRKQRLIAMITEFEARVRASRRGEDLEPLLEEAREALRILEAHNDAGAQV